MAGKAGRRSQRGTSRGTIGWTLFIVSTERRVSNIAQTLGAFDMKPIQDPCPGWQHTNTMTNISLQGHCDWWNIASDMSVMFLG
jgi:hypothetical protein